MIMLLALIKLIAVCQITGRPNKMNGLAMDGREVEGFALYNM